LKQAEAHKLAYLCVNQTSNDGEHPTNGDCIVSDSLSEKIVKHVETARAFERNRQPVLRADSSRTSSRIECVFCGVGIRKETSPVNGMHPKCAKVSTDSEAALTMNVNTHAARALFDREYVRAKRNSDDIKKEEAEKAAHAALIARFNAEEEARNAS
jgi:hypothetical protein